MWRKYVASSFAFAGQNEFQSLLKWASQPLSSKVRKKNGHLSVVTHPSVSLVLKWPERNPESSRPWRRPSLGNSAKQKVSTSSMSTVVARSTSCFAVEAVRHVRFLCIYMCERESRNTDFKSVRVVLDTPGKLGKILLGMNRALGEIPVTVKLDRKSTRLNSSHSGESRMPSSA